MSFDLPKLPDGWEYRPLDQLSKPSSVTYGVVQPGSALSVGVPIIRVNNFRDGRIELADLMRIDPAIEEKYGRTRLKGGEVLLTLVGSVGQVAVAPNTVSGFNVARAVAVIHPEDHVEPEWIALCLRSPLSQHLLGSRANTTVQTTINLKDLRALPIPLPPASERREIASVMSALDDRITLLRETNATLEAIAQALFKSWFVDFDPVRAKAEGRQPEGMDATTAALFPDSFEESEQGLVPKGWRIGKVEDVMDLPYGKALKSTDRIDGDVPVYGSGGITGYHNESLIDGPSIIVGRKGTVGSLYWEDRPFFPIDTVFYVKAKQPLTYCYYLLQTLGLEGMNTDGAVPGLNRNNAYRLQVVVPSAPALQAFDEIVAGVREKIFANGQQAQTLTHLRDTLLPRLISGQLRLPEAMAQITESTTQELINAN
ncbi:restriction endonuclease subunit S [Pseudomonas guguanensis]|uniref:restriction endonuclease subunit S n=2 Tax=Ectopseudomonas guguanensis TaxID=1198456 RepID=UPI00285C3220|nr:restriction endonuclease subunit S [Pseudomonas guguanensis]MDR8016375.1 restriction endonuclease subunit S [Pseudomonas guguanensis]